MTKKILVLTTVISFLVRFINSNYPPLLWDEASLGYNAYSILKTGKDEYGTFLPLIFKSFGDYKPGFYVYLTLPFVAVFGLNSLAVRLPSIILGSLLPVLLYLFIIKLSPKSKIIALISAILLAFNPWNIHFSRGAWETNILLFELILASYLFISKKLFFSSVVFGLTLFTYQGGKIMTPILIISLLASFFSLYQFKHLVLKFFIPILFFSLPILYGLLSQNDANRLKVYSLWSYHRPLSEVTQIINESTPFNYYVFHSETIFFFRNLLTRYFNHFSTKFLIFEGDWQVARHSAPYMGVILFPSLIFLLFGIFRSLILKLNPINKFFLFLLLLSPLPSALTKDIIQPVRCLTLSIPLVYFTAVGISNFLNLLAKYSYWKIVGYIFLFIIYLSSFVYYQDMYYNHMIKVKPQDWLYGYQEAFSYALTHSQNKQVYFTDFYGQPYIYYLFYSKYDPGKYQSQANLISTGIDVGKINQIDNFRFEAANFSTFRNDPKTLMIFSYDDVVRQAVDLKILKPLSPINSTSTFYTYEID